jgi:hypothetical protein
MRLLTSIVWRVLLVTAAVPAVAAVGVQTACSKPQAMHSGQGVPASQGTVRATSGDHGNTKLTIRVKHLAPPWKMAPEATLYVVWVHAPDAASQNVGALTLNANLEGRLDTVTPHRRFRLTITPESNGQAALPSHEPVFTATIDRSD